MFNFVMLLAFKDHLIQKALVKGKYVLFTLSRFRIVIRSSSSLIQYRI